MAANGPVLDGTSQRRDDANALDGTAEQCSDARLLAATLTGDDHAFARLYRRHLPLVLRFCLKQTRNAETAADLAAEVFAQALVSAG